MSSSSIWIWTVPRSVDGVAVINALRVLLAVAAVVAPLAVAWLLVARGLPRGDPPRPPGRK
jgi:hypothetical protein